MYKLMNRLFGYDYIAMTGKYGTNIKRVLYDPKGQPFIDLVGSRVYLSEFKKVDSGDLMFNEEWCNRDWRLTFATKPDKYNSALLLIFNK